MRSRDRPEHVVFAEELYGRLLETARADPNIVGLVLGGSRAKGAYVTDQSDFDVYVVVDDRGPAAEYARKMSTRRGEPVEIVVCSLAEFREHAMPGSATRWNAYTFAHVEPTVDKLDGELAELVRAKALAAPGDDGEFLDAYVNAYYRAAKNARDGRALEAHLDAAESVSWFLEFLFAAHGRVRPYNKWLRWELDNHPLEPGWEGLPERLEGLVATAGLAEQQSLFRDAERLARARGLGHVVDGWDPDVPFLRGEAAPDG